MAGRSEANSGVISALDSLATYATTVEQRLQLKSREQEEEERRIVLKNLNQKSQLSIQEQIAEALRIAKKNEAEKRKIENNKRIERECFEFIFSSRAELFEAELKQVKLYEMVLEDFYMEEIKMDILAKETMLVMEREEKKRREQAILLQILREKEQENNIKVLETKRALEEEMKAKIFAELENIKHLSEKTSQRLKEEAKQKESKNIFKDFEEEERERLLEQVRIQYWYLLPEIPK